MGEQMAAGAFRASQNGVEESSPRDSARAEAGGATDTSNKGLSSDVSHRKTSHLISVVQRDYRTKSGALKYVRNCASCAGIRRPGVLRNL